MNLVHTKYFLDLFKEGSWGSDLGDPISGAGMCFDADCLIDLPPWCNADDLITWIDDFIKWQLMATYYGSTFDAGKGLLRATGCPGFAQSRNVSTNFTIGDVEWSTTTYLDRLLMGCILSYCMEPARYQGTDAGFSDVLKESHYLTALKRWHGGLAKELTTSAALHVQRVLQDWHHFFCAKATDSGPGYLTQSPPPPTGFVPAPPDTLFNAYTLKQILALAEGKSDLVDRVFNVMDRYLELKYQFWPHVVATVESLRIRHCRRDARVGPLIGAADWLFFGLNELGLPEGPMPSRTSKASVALIAKTDPIDGQMWLLQWNRKWKLMNCVSGHREEKDANDLVCMMRELHEELFDALSTDGLARMGQALASAEEYTASASPWPDPYIKCVNKSLNPPHEFPPFVELSASTRQWSRYEFRIYSVELTDAGWNRLFRPDALRAYAPNDKPEGPNEWASCNDIERGWTHMGRPISPTVRRLLEQA